MSTTLTLTLEQYEALVALAQKGAVKADTKRLLDNWLHLIESSNNITRYSLWIQWQEADQPVPPTVQFPETWPPTQRYLLELLTRPISRADVDQILKLKARKPVTVLVTPDPGAIVGWTPVDQYFVR